MTLRWQLMTLGVTLSGLLIAVSKEIWQEVGWMIPDSLAPGIVIPALDKTRERESGDEANVCPYVLYICLFARVSLSVYNVCSYVLYICLSARVCLSVYMSVHIVCMSISLSVCLYCCVCLSTKGCHTAVSCFARFPPRDFPSKNESNYGHHPIQYTNIFAVALNTLDSK